LSEAKKIANQIGLATSTWKEQGKQIGIKSKDLERMSSAFEHQDLKMALIQS
jgi:serine/threonine-protein kinase HipA